MPTVKATYENGVFKPKEPVDLQEKTEVEVLMPGSVLVAEEDPTDWKAIDCLIGAADDEDGPTDVSRNHDECLYGSKRPR